MTDTVEKIEFAAEVQKVLDIVIHSLYQHREIFLRELISNASDALDKRRYEALTDAELLPEGEELAVTITADKEKRELTICDSGIGMNRQDLIENIGTIAKSGTKSFLDALKERGKEGAPELIGQFGVGFYSSFMAADSVTVRTRRAGQKKTFLWRSEGAGGYTVEEADEAPVGTLITLCLKRPEEGEIDFTDEEQLKSIIKKYSDFVTYPITVGAGKEPVNSMKAIWTKPAKDITTDEHDEFYKHLTHDWNDPLEAIRFTAEAATLSFDALLYVPTEALMDHFHPQRKGGLCLYVKRILVMDECRDLTPDYLRFVRGVVDCPDIPLNISRETMQHNPRIVQMRKSIIKKVFDALEAMKNDKRLKYEDFWRAFGKILKEGLYSDKEIQDRTKNLVLFESSGKDKGKLSSFKEYVERMKEGQNEIYYITGESRAAVENSPYLEALRAKGYEVIFFTDPVDEVVIENIADVEGKKLQPAGKGDIKLEDDAAKKEDKERKEKDYKSLLEFLKGKLEKHVIEVRFSDRLTESAVCLVAQEGGLSARLEKLMRENQRPLPANKRIMELNPGHPVVEKMKAMYDSDKDDPLLSDFADLLYGQGALSEGSPLPDPAGYAKLVAKLMAS
ncbi:MAG: molecular chaperone HtpG [Elusimicrobiota bacterium]